jgi:peroxiredoxin
MSRRGRARPLAIGLTAAVALAGVAAVVFATTRTRAAEGSGAGAAAPALSDAAASPSDPIERAIAAVGFHSTMAGASVGYVENLPDASQLLPPSSSLLPVGAVAPSFDLATPTGLHVRLSDYKGKTVLLEFFATWCPHCQAEAQHLLRMQGKLDASKTVFLGINADSEDAASVLAFDRYFGIPYPTLLDQGGRPGSFSQAGGEGPVTRQYGVYYYPTFFIVSPQGRIAWRGDREQPDAVLLKELAGASGS